jgi:uracil-DNA glycosylase family 4
VKRSTPALPVAHLHRLGMRAVRNLNPAARHPNMPPTGSRRPVLYVLGEAPGATEDARGRQFIGESGKLLRMHLDGVKTRWDNCCRTRPPKNRKPTPAELEAHRPDIENSLAQARPGAVLAAGGVAWGFLSQSPYNVTVARGRRFPLVVKDHPLWVYPIWHPAYILRRQGEDPGVRRVFDLDLERVVSHLPCEPPEVVDPATLDDGLHLVTGCDADALRRLKVFCKRLAERQHVTVDVETTGLRPYAGHRLLSIAVGTHKKVMAVTLGGWGQREKEVRRILRTLLSSTRVIAHHAAFEMEWFISYFKSRHFLVSDRWEDTMQQAFVLDERSGGHSLDFCCRLHLGLALKSVTNVDRGRLEDLPVEKLLRYNALDVKYTALLFRKQQKRVKAEGLEGIYREQCRRLPAIVLSQHAGLPVDVGCVERTRKNLRKQVAGLERQIAKSKAVKKFEKLQRKKFSPASTKDVAVLFRDVLKRREGETHSGGYSTKKDVLEQIKLPVAGRILEHRAQAKNLSTYVERLHPDAPATLVYPDGKLHPSISVIRTATGRLAYEEPNAQNFPKRHDAYIRAQIIPPPGFKMVAVDYAQIEARVIAMFSGDEFMQKSIREGYDIHMDFAKQVAKMCPRALKERGDMKTLRSEVKNQFVFPAFYGAHDSYISKMLGIPPFKGKKLFDIFWEKFAGVYAWQKDLLARYDEKHYVDMPTGRRRRAPLDKNRIINSGVQGSASDIVVDAMVRLCEYAAKTKRWQYVPVLNVHDDLTFFLPEETLERDIKRIVRMMLRPSYDWVTLQMGVEVSVGVNWFELKEVGKYEGE